MMNIETALDEVPIGLLEIDSEGTVLFYRAESSGKISGGGQMLAGRNLFTDIMRATNREEFKSQLESFKQSHQPARSFNFVLNFECASYPIRVLLARTREQSERGERRSLLVHIRRA